MSAEEKMIDWDKLEPMINEIKVAAEISDTEKIYTLLVKLIPEYRPSLVSSPNNPQ